MKIFILLPFLLVSFSSAYAVGLQVSKIKSFPKNYGPHKPKGASRCAGRVDKEKTAKFSWIQERIAAGIDCLSADFDGNGTKDYALLKEGWSSDTSGATSTEVVALMYDSDGLSKALLVTPNHSIFTFEIYPARKKRGPFGEPISKNSGLVEWGEGDATTVWLYKNGKFESSDFASESQ